MSDNCRKKLKMMHRELETITELYQGLKAQLMIAEQQLEKEKIETDVKVKTCEEKCANI